jgi:hypothetical protein
MNDKIQDPASLEVLMENAQRGDGAAYAQLLSAAALSRSNRISVCVMTRTPVYKVRTRDVAFSAFELRLFSSLYRAGNEGCH